MQARPSLPVQYLDGRSARAQAAELSVAGQQLCLTFPASAEVLNFDVRGVRWSERTAKGARSADLPGGVRLQATDAQAWDAFVRTHVRRDSWVVRAQQSWRGVAAALVVLLAVCSGLYLWGLPALAAVVTPMIPHSVDETLGSSALAQLDGRLFEPSTLPPEVQARLRERVSRVLAQPGSAPAVPAMRLEFRKSKIGPNALALPGGTVIVTDELVRLVQDDDTVLGVIGHEWGHVRHRHSMRQLVQVTALQAGLSLAMGDYGSFLMAAPLALATMSYSRDHERQADREAVLFMRQAGISPGVMVRFFERVAERRSQPKPERSMGISIVSSHPDDAERIAFFRAAAQQP